MNWSTLQEFDLISFFENMLEASAKIVLSLFGMFFEEKFLFVLILRLNDGFAQVLHSLPHCSL